MLKYLHLKYNDGLGLLKMMRVGGGRGETGQAMKG